MTRGLVVPSPASTLLAQCGRWKMDAGCFMPPTAVLLVSLISAENSGSIAQFEAVLRAEFAVMSGRHSMFILATGPFWLRYYSCCWRFLSVSDGLCLRRAKHLTFSVRWGEQFGVYHQIPDTVSGSSLKTLPLHHCATEAISNLATSGRTLHDTCKGDPASL